MLRSWFQTNKQASTPAYKYDNILKEDQIRLLQFSKPGSPYEPLSLKITGPHSLPKDVHENPEQPYVTLSYVWGLQLPNRMHEIRLNGTRFMVGSNLLAALHHLEPLTDGLPFWIDAICINQDASGTNPEKNTQVAQMNRVYGCSQHTIVYLGDSDAHTKVLFSHLKLLGDTARQSGILELDLQTIANWSKLGRPEVLVGHNSHSKAVMKAKVEALIRDIQSGTIEFSKADMTAFSRLTNRAWFKRLWIIQELCLARHCIFICGEENIDYDVLSAAFHICNLLNVQRFHSFAGKSLKDRPLILLGIIALLPINWFAKMVFGMDVTSPSVLSSRAAFTLGTRRRYRKSQSSETKDGQFTLKENLLRALWPVNNGILACGYPKDRIYALLGVSSDTKELDIPIQYDDNVGYEDVHRNVIKTLLERGHVDLLCFAQPNWSEEKGFPSWMLDLTQPLPVSWAGTAADGLFNATKTHISAESPLHFFKLGCSKEVRISAYKVGTLLFMSRPPQRNGKSKETTTRDFRTM
jgi:hypothetical protein